MAVLEGMAPAGAGVIDELARSIVEHPSAVPLEALVGVPAKSMRISLAPAGVAFRRGKQVDAYSWSEVRAVRVRRGTVLVKTEAARERVVRKKDSTTVQPYTEKRTRGIRVVVDGVTESSIAAPLARVLEEMRSGTFSYQGTSWIAYVNSLDALHTDFDAHDDPSIPMTAASLWLAVGLMAALVIPVGVNAATLRSVPAGSFALWDPLGTLDPRGVIAAFAFSAMVAGLGLRLALGRAAVIWGHGAARGWARPDSGRLKRLAVRQLARMVMAPASAAVIVLLALVTYWPNVAATVLVSPSGVRNTVLVPFVSVEEPWRAAVEITRQANGTAIRFADGRVLTTVGHELGGGTQQQFFDLVTAWRAAAR
jgi:hypothetical protein